jgi:hypothetical protein
MSHFIYELVRGKFGAITEAAIMMTQLDPMINASKEITYSEKEAKNLAKHFYHKNRNSGLANTQENSKLIEEHPEGKNMEQQIRTIIFECPSCKQLSIKENRGIFDANERICNLCITRYRKFDMLYHNKTLQSIIQTEMKKGSFKLITNLSELMSIANYESVIFLH